MAKLTSKPSPTPLRADTPAVAAARSALAELLGLARGLEQGIVDDEDPEFVHQHRVCLRRARSLSKVLDGALERTHAKRLRKRLKAAAKATNRLRDLDVFLEQRALLEGGVAPGLASGLAELFDSLQAERDEAQRVLAERLGGLVWNAELAAVAAGIATASPGDHADEPVQELVKRSLVEAYRGVLDRGRAVDEATTDDELHELRLACKALRYTLEPAAPLLGAEGVKPVVKQLKRLQDVLGRFNDLAVQQRTVQAWLATHDVVSAEAAAASTALVQDLRERQETTRQQVLAALSGFDTPELARRLQALTGHPPQEER